MTATVVLKNVNDRKGTFAFGNSREREFPAMSASGGTYSYALPNSPLGGIEDRYVRINGECHPDFLTVPIGNPYGAKLCIRPPPREPYVSAAEFQRQGAIRTPTPEKPFTPNGYYRGSVNLYNVYQKYPQQDWDPYAYADRRTLWEGDLIERDILREEVKYDGTGINPVRTPHQLFDADAPYFEYQQSFTTREDPQTGLRTATSWADTVVPPKYDVTRLHQPYVSWKREYEYMGHPQNDQDRKNWKRIV